MSNQNVNLGAITGELVVAIVKFVASKPYSYFIHNNLMIFGFGVVGFITGIFPRTDATLICTLVLLAANNIWGLIDLLLSKPAKAKK